MVIREDMDDAVYFVGPEVETSPAFSMKTLFVVGVRGIEQMAMLAEENNCKHIYLGGNRSFQENKKWGDIVPALLDKGFWVTLDYPATSQEFVVATLPPEASGHPHFIPMISCVVACVETFNKNLTLKIDDVDFNDTNSGVWCLPVNQLLDSNRYTPWAEYGHDEVIVRDDDMAALKARQKSK